MKIVSSITLVAGMFISSTMLTAIDQLSNLTDYVFGLGDVDFSAGHLASLFTDKQFWGQYPSFALPGSWTDFYTAAIACGVIGALLYAMRGRLRASFGSVGVATLALAVVPYLLGMFMLRGGTLDPSIAGQWVSVMLTGPLCCGVTASMFALVELFAKGRKALVG